MDNFVDLRMNDLKREINSHIHDVICTTIIETIKWKDGEYPDIEDIGHLRDILKARLTV